MRILSSKERLVKIVDLSCQIFKAKIINGEITLENEASMQLQLGLILKSVGKLYEWSDNDRFNILLEKKFDISQPTAKSQNLKARCDIYLEMQTKQEDSYKVGMEVKYFPKLEGETTTENRMAILKDIENLEVYIKDGFIDTGVTFVYTTNSNYANPQTSSSINIGQGVKTQIGASYKSVRLSSSYKFTWDCYPETDNVISATDCFLELYV